MPRAPVNLFDIIADQESIFRKGAWHGLYRGRVEDIDDPEQRGRLKVRVTGLHPEVQSIPVNHIQWAESLFGDGGFNYGDFHIPYRLGDWVYVMFLAGHPDNPVWFGSWYGQDAAGTSEAPEEVRTIQYPHRRIIKTRRGHKIELSDELGDLEIKITDAKGNFIWLDSEEDKLKIYWQGNVEGIVTQDMTWRIDRDLNVVVGRDFNLDVHRDFKSLIVQDYLLDVLRNRSARVGAGGTGEDTVGVTGNMWHYTGGNIYHNQGGSAVPVSHLTPLPDPLYTVQQRRPAFPDRIATLETMSRGMGVPAAQVQHSLSVAAAVATRCGQAAPSVQSGVAEMCNQVKMTKTAGTTPTVLSNAMANVSTSRSKLTDSRRSFNKAAVEINRLKKLGAPITDNMMGSVATIAAEGQEIAEDIDATAAPYADAAAALGTLPPDTRIAGESLETISPILNGTSVKMDRMRYDMQQLRTDLESAKNARELNIGKSGVQTQNIRYNIGVAQGYIDESTMYIDQSKTSLTSGINDTEYCRQYIYNQNGATINTVDRTLGSMEDLLRVVAPEEVVPMFQMLEMILDVTQQGAIIDLLDYIAAETTYTYAQIRQALVDEPESIISVLVTIMNMIPHRDIQDLAQTLDVGFGVLSNIDDVAAAHGFGPALLTTISALKMIGIDSTKAISSGLSAIGISPLEDLSIALLQVQEGHMGRIADVASQLGIPGLDDITDRVNSFIDTGITEASAVAFGSSVVPQTVIGKASEMATMVSQHGGYPMDDPVIRLPDGVVVESLVD